ncbi:hypothetical protein BJ742DRAFT_789414 [Cladochytrium replicatum]|nr:hypothetical protein BJ742DRAFT_789414 [Cladochytrium replicatum]
MADLVDNPVCAPDENDHLHHDHISRVDHELVQSKTSPTSFSSYQLNNSPDLTRRTSETLHPSDTTPVQNPTGRSRSILDGFRYVKNKTFGDSRACSSQQMHSMTATGSNMTATGSNMISTGSNTLVDDQTVPASTVAGSLGRSSRTAIDPQDLEETLPLRASNGSLPYPRKANQFAKRSAETKYEMVESCANYLRRYHTRDIMRAITDAQRVLTLTHAIIPQYRVVLQINPGLFIDHNINLANDTLNNLYGSHGNDIFQHACFDLTHERVGTEYIVIEEQVRVTIRLGFLMDIPGYHLSSIADGYAMTRNKSHMLMNQLHLQKAIPEFVGDFEETMGPTLSELPFNLFSVRGCVVTVCPTKYVPFSRMYRCVSRKCRNRNYVTVYPTAQHVRVVKRDEYHVRLGVTTSMELHGIDRQCSQCGVKMEESGGDRTFNERQEMELRCLSPNGCCSNTIWVTLEDELVNIVEKGDFLEVIGTLDRPDSTKYRCEMKVNNARKLHWAPVFNPLWNLKWFLCAECPDTFATKINLPKLLIQLQSELSPFRFTQRLVDAFCVDAVPSTVWRKLKLMLLISLVSVPPTTETVAARLSRIANKAAPDNIETDVDDEDDEAVEAIRKAVHVFVHADCRDPLLWRLLRRAASFRRNAEWYPNVNLTDHGDRVPALCANAIDEAKNGVLLVNNDFVKRRDAQNLYTALQQPITRLVSTGGRSITKGTSSGSMGYMKSHASWTAAREMGAGDGACVLMSETRFASWVVCEGGSKKGRSDKKDGFEDRGFGGSEINIPPFAREFDAMVRLQGASDQADRKISQMILLESFDVESEDAADVSESELMKWIYSASSLHVKISDPCQALLQAYFSASRRMNGESMSVGMMETLTRIAISHTKLCMRTEASVDDAVVSIMLVEESTAAGRGGPTPVLGFHPLPKDSLNIFALYSDVPMNDVDLNCEMDLRVMEHEFGDAESIIAPSAFNESCIGPFVKQRTDSHVSGGCQWKGDWSETDVEVQCSPPPVDAGDPLDKTINRFYQDILRVVERFGPR